MDSLALAAGVLALVWAHAVMCTAAFAIIKRWWRGRRRGRAAQPAPASVLVVRPCAGDEPELEESLASIGRLSTRHRVAVVVGVSTTDDAALPAAHRAALRLRERGIDARIEVIPPAGPNRKASILEGVARIHGTGHAIVVSADSNVDLGGFEIDRLVDPLLTGPRVGATWAPAAERPARLGLGYRASEAVLSGSLHAFGLLSSLDPDGLVGKLFAVRTDALDEAGGFGVLTDYLGEDMEMSRRLREAGWGVRPVPAVARAVPSPRSLGSVVSRHARWMTVIRAQRPWLLATYPLFFASTPFLLALAIVAAAGHPWLALAAAGWGVAARLLTGLGARVYSGQPWDPVQGVVDAVLADIVLLSALARALRSRRVEWRGNVLSIDRRGRLQEV